jgi:dethiobiotin synthetase
VTRRLLFVTGTDTGVGKTFVSRGILRACVRSGTAVFPLKLAETGCAILNGELVPSDGLLLASAAGRTDLDDVAPLRFTLPASPRAAAVHEARPLSLAQLLECVDVAFSRCELVLLEGAGGLMVPLTDQLSFADLAQELRATVLVVARDALGTLNHTQLTLEALRRRGLTVLAVVLNAVGPTPYTLGNAQELQRLSPRTPILGPLPWLPGATDDALGDAVEAAGLSAAMLAQV